MRAFAYLAPVGLLALSNIAMNFAWYAHLKTPQRALWLAILGSWAIALIEYCLAVPANRIGTQAYSLAQLKTIQEVMSLSGFVLVAWWLFDMKPGFSQLAGFALIAAGAFMIFSGAGD